MNPRQRTIEACNASVIRPAFGNKIPPRNVEDEATKAWIAVDRLTTADPRGLRENIQAIAEMREKLDLIFERVKS